MYLVVIEKISIVVVDFKIKISRVVFSHSLLSLVADHQLLHEVRDWREVMGSDKFLNFQTINVMFASF